MVHLPPSHLERVLISAAIPNDARLTAEFLGQAGLQPCVCADLFDLCTKVTEGCGLAFVAEELLHGEGDALLSASLARQPSWSDIPILIIASTGSLSESRLRQLISLGNVTLLERPLRPGTLISNVEVALRSRRRQYQVRDLVEEREAMVASISDAFATFDREWRCTFSNDRVAILSGQPPDRILGSQLWDLFPDLADAARQRDLTSAVAEGAQFHLDSFHPFLNRWLEIRIYPSPSGVSVFASDITDRKQSEEALREARSRLQATLAAAEIGTWTWDIEKDLVAGDENLARLFGLTPAQARGPVSSFLGAVHADDRNRVEMEIDRAMVTGSFESDYRLVQEDGTVRWVTARGRVERDSSGKPFRFPGVIIDVTERKKQQEALDAMSTRLKEQAKIFDTALSHINDFAYILDLQGRFIYANKSLLDLWGLPSDQAVGKTFSQLPYPPEMAAHLQRQVQKVIDTRRGIRDETVYTTPAGREVFYEYIFTPVFNSEGRVEVVVGSTRDVTERKNIQNELEQRVQQRTAELTETNSQLETLVYSIAHDLRAPLRSMQAFAQMLHNDYAPSLDATARDYAKRIVRSSERLDVMVLDLLNYGRIARADLKMEPVEVETAWQAAIDQHREDIKQRQASIETVRPLPTVRAHETTLSQVLANLIGNGLKFTREGIPPAIRLRAEDKGDYVRLWIEDEGIGIPPEYHERVFRVFERLHGTEYGGTGIGLSIVRKGVERMGGRVGLESARNQGSRFWLELMKA